MMVTPDLLIMNDGSAVDVRRWPQRRQELYHSIIPHEYGGMPPRGEGIEILRRSQNRVNSQPGGTHSIYEVRVISPAPVRSC